MNEDIGASILWHRGGKLGVNVGSQGGMQATQNPKANDPGGCRQFAGDQRGGSHDARSDHPAKADRDAERHAENALKITTGKITAGPGHSFHLAPCRHGADSLITTIAVWKAARRMKYRPCTGKIRKISIPNRCSALIVESTAHF
jgi:hypothetical protein